jgi:hypothetical protein
LLLVISSVAFGAAHYLAGGGWDIGKISTAALAGFAMGLVYLRYGAYAPILLHWFFDYYFGAFDLASQLNLAGLGLLSAGINILNIGAGALFTLAFGAMALRKAWTALGLDSRTPRTQASSIGEFPNSSLGDTRSLANAVLLTAGWPKCRTCGVPMTPADEKKQYWYCYRDHQWFLSKQNAWVAEQEGDGRVFCYHCGEPLPPDALFCPGCGTSQKNATS